MTRREAYDIGVEQLEAEGIENADCDIRILLEDLCGVDREELFLQGDKIISRRESEIFMNAVTRRMGHYPVQYITGKQEFMGLTFSVNQNVLIPRMDTEILVEEVLKELDDGSRILDMCTGSGCIFRSIFIEATTGLFNTIESSSFIGFTICRQSKFDNYITASIFERSSKCNLH